MPVLFVLLLISAALAGQVSALNLYPPEYTAMQQGEIYTASPPNSKPVPPNPLTGVSKVAANPHGCAKNVALDCPGVQLVKTDDWKGNRTNGCGPDKNSYCVAEI